MDESTHIARTAPSGTAMEVDDEETATEEVPSTTRRTLGTLQLAVIVFYSVSGGPFGIEEAVRSAGPLFTLLGFALFPLVWSLPEAAITAELGSAYPEAAGGVAWVEEAFGSQAGWMSGFLGWVSGATDTAIYPVLFLDYLVQVLSGGIMEVHPVLRFAMIASLASTLTFINYLGLQIVGELSLLICLVSMSPFVLACILGFSKVDPHRWLVLPSDEPVAMDDDDVDGGLIPSFTLGGVLWAPFLNNLFWNLNSFDSGASFSAEVHNPEAFPKAMFWSVLFVVLSYLVPLLIVLGATDATQSAWVDGYLAKAISDVVGRWLGDWTVFAAGISNLALFQAEVSADAYQLMGMSDRGLLPQIFGTRSRYGTPTYGLLLGLTVVLVMSISDLSTLIELLNFNYAISLLMEYVAFIKLRISKPHVHRPYRIPLSTVGCCLALTPTVLLTVFVMSLASLSTYIFSALSVAVGYAIFRVRHQRGARFCEYSEVPPALEQSESDLSDFDNFSMTQIT